MAYHYVESGLDNVHLENGFHLLETSHGTAVSIEDVHGLHAAIGRCLIDAAAPLTGAELRFLRIEMELSQRALAGLLGTTEQTCAARREGSREAVPGPVDHLLRALYADFVGGRRLGAPHGRAARKPGAAAAGGPAGCARPIGAGPSRLETPSRLAAGEPPHPGRLEAPDDAEHHV